MIVDYKYCGYHTDRKHGNTRIWGAATFLENGYTETYMFWGSSKSPIIRKYRFGQRTKKETLAYKIKEKRDKWSSYVELTGSQIENTLPELASQIGMHVLHKKLKGI
jgi:hypothetical protein